MQPSPKMRTNPGPPPGPENSGGWLARWGVLLAGGGLVLAVWAAYANSFATPFVFDDLKSINDNPSIRHLSAWREVLSPPPTVTGALGRPVVNLSLAVNYAFGGLAVQGYHVFNTVVHALAGLVLLGVVRRTLLRPVVAGRGVPPIFFAGPEVRPTLFAFVVALLWVLHPLQTESVTCVVQRTESLMGLFYLVTLYAFIRSVESPAPGRWQITAVAVCLVGMATKEVMVSAPLLVLLYDRTFVAGSFRAAWRARGRMYIGLAATWLLLAWLVVQAKNRGGLASIERGISSWEYLLTQCRAIVLYLRLSVWPSPLVVDYGAPVVRHVAEVWLPAALLLALAAGTFLALWRRPVLGFVGFWFFAILAPSSSFVPLVTQTIAEHRMYLPLAAVILLLVVGGYLWLGRRSLPVWLAVAAGAGWLTAQRNEDYRDPLTLWGVTVAQQPDNSRARMNYGTALSTANRLEEARDQFATAVRLLPGFPEAHYSLAGVLIQLRQPAEAAEQAGEAIRLKPDFAEAHYVLGTALLQQSGTEAAVEQFETALRLRPNFADAEHTLAGTLAMIGRTAGALEHYEAALRLQPANPLLHLEMGNVLAQAGRLEEAVLHFTEAIRLNPDSVAAHYNLGNAVFALRRVAEAADQYAAVVQLRPEFAEARNNLGNALTQLGRYDEAQAQYEEALRLNPDFGSARNNLQRLQTQRVGGSPR